METILVKAFIAGIETSLITSILGCLITWRRMVSFGDAYSHIAILGVAIALIFGVEPIIGSILVTLSLAIILYRINNNGNTNNQLLLIIAYTALACAIALTSLFKMRIDFESYLFGDILIIDWIDIYILSGLILILFIWLKIRWRGVLLLAINQDIATLNKVNSKRLNFEFLLIMSVSISLIYKMAGALLITSMLVIPAASARIFSKTPEEMLKIAFIINCCCSVFGLLISITYDVPSGAGCVICLSSIYLISNVIRLVKK